MENKTLYIIISILVIHWIADFVLQTDWQAKNKSINWNALIQHTTTYSLCWWIPTIIFLSATQSGYSIGAYIVYAWVFVCVTFIFHTATDYVTSRMTRRLYEQGRIHDFFVVIGFDQILHYVQLFVTYKLMMS